MSSVSSLKKQDAQSGPLHQKRLPYMTRVQAIYFKLTSFAPEVFEKVQMFALYLSSIIIITNKQGPCHTTFHIFTDRGCHRVRLKPPDEIKIHEESQPADSLNGFAR